MINKKNKVLTIKVSDAKDVGVFYSVGQIRINDVEGNFDIIMDSTMFSYPRLDVGSDIIDETSSDTKNGFSSETYGSDISSQIISSESSAEVSSDVSSTASDVA